MAKTREIWIDHQGNEIPSQYVTRLMKVTHRLVAKKLKKAQDLEEKLITFKKGMFDDCDQLWLEMQEAENVRTGKKSYSLTTFDKSAKIEIDQAERIEFDSNIELAKAKIDEFLEEKMKDSDSDIKAIVHQAFETDKGRLDVKRVLGLKRLKISHPLWVRAMKLIDDSMSRNNSKRYIRISEKDAMGEYQAVKLNISAI